VQCADYPEYEVEDEHQIFETSVTAAQRHVDADQTDKLRRKTKLGNSSQRRKLVVGWEFDNRMRELGQYTAVEFSNNS